MNLHPDHEFLRFYHSHVVQRVSEVDSNALAVMMEDVSRPLRLVQILTDQDLASMLQLQKWSSDP